MFKDTFLSGLTIGISLPIVTFGILTFINSLLISGETEILLSFKRSTVGIFAICSNLIPTIFANRRYMENFIRGIMFPTVLGAFFWFFWFDPLRIYIGS